MASLPLTDWMAALDGQLELGRLTIPGTHDTAARQGGLKAVTQSLDVQSQLTAGIRFFDIRLKDDAGVMRLFHDDVDERLEFEPGALEPMLAYLAGHPGETLIMSVMQAAAGDAAAFARDFEALLAGRPESFHVGADFPRLADVRGKIVLLRRFAGSGLGIAADPSQWQGNATFEISAPAGTLTIEDHWDLAHSLPWELGDKWNAVARNLDAAAGSTGGWFLTFTSAMSDLSSPRLIAGGFPLVDGINKRLLDYVGAHPGPRRLGTVVMDFPELPDPRLVQALVDTNRG
jgi:1-phosphatidylinositol phosphodiesterase